MSLLPDFSRNLLLLLRQQVSTLQEIKWGAWALVALYISLASGLLVGLQYDYLHPFYSTSAIDLLAPFGRFYRSLHFYSSQIFFFFCCGHLVAVYPKTRNYNTGEWLRLVGSLPLVLLLLFTGYILRGDNTGSSAGIIAENIMKSVPFIGTSLNDLLFSLTANGLRKVYLHHVITLDLLFLIFLWNHLRIYRIKIREHLSLISLILFFSVFISAPLEPDRLGISYISGPWFFLGLQELLRYFSPLLAGIVAPGLFLVLLLSASPANKYSRLILLSLGLLLGCYTVLTVIAWSR